MSDLKNQLIKLGSTNPELRPHIREVLAKIDDSTDLLSLHTEYLLACLQRLAKHATSPSRIGPPPGAKFVLGRDEWKPGKPQAIGTSSVLSIGAKALHTPKIEFEIILKMEFGSGGPYLTCQIETQRNTPMHWAVIKAESPKWVVEQILPALYKVVEKTYAGLPQSFKRWEEGS